MLWYIYIYLLQYSAWSLPQNTSGHALRYLILHRTLFEVYCTAMSCLLFIWGTINHYKIFILNYLFLANFHYVVFSMTDIFDRVNVKFNELSSNSNIFLKLNPKYIYLILCVNVNCKYFQLWYFLIKIFQFLCRTVLYYFRTIQFIWWL